MSFFLGVQTALDTQLYTLNNDIDIAWENINYTPIKESPYLRPTVMMSPSSLLNLDVLQLNEGIYQVDLFYPLEQGSGDLSSMADRIYDLFKSQQQIVSNDTTVYIKQISRTTPAIVEDAWFMASVEINFKCYET